MEAKHLTALESIAAACDEIIAKLPGKNDFDNGFLAAHKKLGALISGIVKRVKEEPARQVYAELTDAQRGIVDDTVSDLLCTDGWQHVGDAAHDEITEAISGIVQKYWGQPHG